MNTRLRFLTAGESHGPLLTAILEGMPAGLSLAPDDLDRDMARPLQFKAAQLDRKDRGYSC